ncbi:MAG: hypothetical protein Ct9H300mP28_29870 [Pseudomonadota bacterium]|nr:MAG: hypothetical protein Ct9H300mP28_29870 [Pseudomonadota bacterium]
MNSLKKVVRFFVLSTTERFRPEIFAISVMIISLGKNVFFLSKAGVKYLVVPQFGWWKLISQFIFCRMVSTSSSSQRC